MVTDLVRNTQVNYSSLKNQLEISVLRGASIAVVGVGGSSDGARSFVHSGVGSIMVVDPDVVSASNVPTQGYGLHQVGSHKAEALAADAAQINPDVEFEAHACRFEDLPEDVTSRFWAADLHLALTDNFAVQAALNAQAVARGKDIIFGGCYPGGLGTEIVGSFPDAIAAGKGCYRCLTDPRFRAQERQPTPPRSHQRHIFLADMLNAQLGLLAIGLLHERAGSDLAIAKSARCFIDAPLMVTRMEPDFMTAAGEMFCDLPAGYGALVSRHWGKDVPQGFICPDCGTPEA